MRNRFNGMIATLSLSAASLISSDVKEPNPETTADILEVSAPEPETTATQKPQSMTPLQKLYLERAKIFEEHGGFPRKVKTYRQLAAGETFRDRVEETEVAGDPKVGLVLYIRQLHHNALTGEADEVTQAYQQRIYEELKGGWAKDIFEEGTWIDEENREKAHGGLYQMAKGKLQPEEAETLVRPLGAVPAYFLGHKGVTVHGVETDLTDKMVMEVSAMSEGRPFNGEKLKLLEQQREKIIAQVIMDFLGKNPGKTATLVLGVEHELSDEIGAYENPPVLRSISFPKLLAEKAKQQALKDYK